MYFQESYSMVVGNLSQKYCHLKNSWTEIESKLWSDRHTSSRRTWPLKTMKMGWFITVLVRKATHWMVWSSLFPLPFGGGFILPNSLWALPSLWHRCNHELYWNSGNIGTFPYSTELGAWSCSLDCQNSYNCDKRMQKPRQEV